MIRSFLTRSPEHRILVVTSPSIIDPTSNTPKVVVRIRCGIPNQRSLEKSPKGDLAMARSISQLYIQRESLVLSWSLRAGDCIQYPSLETRISGARARIY